MPAPDPALLPDSLAPDSLAPDPLAPDALREAAERLRDARDWPAAAAHYAAYLAARPEDRAALVQHGHALKEAGDPAAALACYQEAARRDPADADIHLQLGHALKLLGRLPEARAAYGESLLLAPQDTHAWAEYLALAAIPATPRATSDLAIDLSDLLAWFGANRTPSGIQRVQLGVLAAALAMRPPPRLVAMGRTDPAWRELPHALAARLAALASSGADPAAPEWCEATALAAALPEARVRFPAGGRLFNPGTAWAWPQQPAALQAARQEAPLISVTLVHDCGPLVVPETCPPGLAADYAAWFSTACVMQDGLLANSAATAADVARFAALVTPQPPPIATIPLAAADLAPPAPDDPALPPADEPFVLFVGTLETRKDHPLAFAAWRLLLARHGAAQVPRLLCVGRQGPGAEAALGVLAAEPALAAHITLLHGIDDHALAALYQRCAFTLYTSRHEGWGLPVSESLAHGRIPVVPAHASLPEAAAGGGVLFAPGDAADLADKLSQLLFDPAFRAAAEARLADAPRPRPWAEVGAALIAAACRVAPRVAQRPALPAGRILPLGTGSAALPSPALALAALLRAGTDWAPPEAWGCATRPGGARLDLALAAPAGDGMLLSVALRGVAAEARPCLRLGGAATQRLALAAGEAASLTLAWPAGASSIALVIDCDAPVGVSALLLHAAGDLAAPLTLLEYRLLRGPGLARP